MVGVAGRSKGCVTCRQRRVKCDETHPECSRCKKANRVCAGYLQNNFIDGLPSGVRKAAHASQQQRKPPPPPPQQQQQQQLVLSPGQKRQPPASRLWANFLDSGAVVSDDDSSSDASSAPELGALGNPAFWSSAALPFSSTGQMFYGPSSSRGQTPCPSLDYTGFKDTLFLNYAAERMIKGISMLYAPSAAEVRTVEGTLNLDCLLSISTAYFGFQHHNQRIVQLGMQRYGSALTELNKALMHPVLCKSAQVLNAVTIMMLYEFLAPTSSTGWADHVLGLERLIYHRGPEAHMSGIAHEQFTNSRSSIVYACLAVEKPCLLASPEWITVPWSLNPAAKWSFQRLLDIVIDLPELISIPTKLWTTENPSAELYEQAFRANRDFKAKLTELDEWWDIWHLEHEDAYWEVPADYSELEPSHTPTRWNTVYEFKDVRVANDFATYHAIKVLVLALSRYIDSLGPGVKKAHLTIMATSAQTSGMEICRTVDYHLRDDHRGGGGLLLLFPFRLAWKSLGGDTPEGRWLEDVITNTSSGLSGEWNGATNLIFGPFTPRNAMDDIRSQV